MESISVHRKDPKAKKARVKLFEKHLKLYRELWESAEADVESRWSELLRQSTAALVTSLQRSARLWTEQPDSRAQLSAAVLLLGANTPDHVRLFRRLRRAINAEVTPHMVSLRAAMGPLPSLMRHLVKKLVSAEVLRDLDLSAPLKTSFHAIEGWYARTQQKRPIVVLLEDCDVFSPKALQDLVTVSSAHAANLPLQLVLGVASHIGVVHSLLGGMASSRLRLQLLRAPSPPEFRRKVLEPSLASGCAVRLGPRVHALLLDLLFGRLDLASHSCCRRWKLCLLEHVLRLPTSTAAALTAGLRGHGEVARQLRDLERADRFRDWAGRLLRCDLSAESLRVALDRASSAALATALPQALLELPEKVGDDAVVQELQTRLSQLCAELHPREESARPAHFHMETKMSLKALQAGLKEMHAQQQPDKRALQKVREILLNAGAVLCPELSSDSCLLFDDAAGVRALINPSQRADFQTALSRPSIYLNAESSSEEEVIVLSPRMPDLSILFKLHLECPHFINLYDWLQAFAAVLGEGLDENAAPSRTVQARFAQGVAELQFLGLIKATRRKTDHVARLTWGTC